ncbi:MAG: succinate dehydrogenase assembly factor 2 [Alteromonadaceae bacterium]|nr:MAG: succinate dehydrogenase assembly factor 2 [Alteromonadaceae bacterium]
MDINRLRWATRRGMLELDLILLPFLENFYPQLEPKERELFETLLLSEDQDLFRWFINSVEPEDEGILTMVTIIRKSLSVQAGS